MAIDTAFDELVKLGNEPGTTAWGNAAATTTGDLPPGIGISQLDSESDNTYAQTQTVAIVGMGYVGLPTALSYLDAGQRVIGLDLSQRRIDAIAASDVDLLPRDLDRLHRHLRSDRLRLSTDPTALADADTVIVCVPTPVTKNLVPDLAPLAGACASVVANAVPGQLIVLTSTTYVGCTRDMVVVPLQQRGLTTGTDVFVAFSPERIDPGVVDHRPESTPRVVGGVSPACSQRAVELLAPTCHALHVVSSPETAEMSKLLENTFRATNIALINEFADVACELGVDITEVIDAASTKPYGFMRFMPGPGVGGHCIPCDPHYLTWQMRGHRRSTPVVDATMGAIAARPSHVVQRAIDCLAQDGVRLGGARVHVVGVAFKPGVADMRESPATEIIEGLMARGASVSYGDDHVPDLKVDGAMLHSQPAPADTDLVLVLVVHPGSDLGWMAGFPRVLDASFALRAGFTDRV